MSRTNFQIWLESFTGTGAIAIAPNVSFKNPEEDDDEEKETSESQMTRNNDVLNEWDPSFEGGDYKPGDYQMPSPSGSGVADRKVTKDKVGKYETDTSQDGDEWPREHGESAAMGKVDNSGVDSHSQGSHESSVGAAEDGYQKKVGHDWPKGPKNDGGGVAEPMSGDRWSDGGTLSGGKGQNDFGSAKTNTTSMPSDGPITGVDGPQYGQVSEGWSPSGIGQLMGGEFDIQAMFEDYARNSVNTSNVVDLNSFLELCEAYGADAYINESSLEQFMDANTEFLFHERTDANGRYWIGTPLSEEWNKPWEKDGKGEDSDSDSDDNDSDDNDSDDDCVEEGAVRRPFSNTISELQVRSPRDEAMGAGIDEFSNHELEDPLEVPDANPMDGMGLDAGPMGGMPGAGPEAGFDPMQGSMDMPNIDDADSMAFDDGGGMADMPSMVADRDRGGNIAISPDMGPAHDPDLDDGIDFEQDFGLGKETLDRDAEYPTDSKMYAPMHDLDTMESVQYSQNRVDALSKFFGSAKSITSTKSDPRTIGEALNDSWAYYAAGINPKSAPPKVQNALKNLMRQYEQFNPLLECGDMGESQGKPIGSEGGSPSVSPDLASEDNPGPEEMKDHGDGFGASQKNTIGTPIVKGTGKGMTGGKVSSESVRANVNVLGKHVQRSLSESLKSIGGKYGLAFHLLVNEGEVKNRTKARYNLAEALADAEELIQIHGHKNVVLETYAIDSNKELIRKVDTPMIKISKRGPIVSEGAAIFRFSRTAHMYAEILMTEGVTCRVNQHNWGQSVMAPVNSRKAKSAFKSMIK